MAFNQQSQSDQPQGPNPNQDVVIAGPTDTVSQLVWSPRANLLLCASWDKQVRLWEVSSNGQATPKAMINHDAPVLSCCFSADGGVAISGGCDKKVMMWDMASGKHQQCGAHDGPVSVVGWSAAQNCVMSAGWDKTVRYWDGRQNVPALKVDMPERVFTGDMKGPLGIFGTADRKIAIFDMRNPREPFKHIDSPLKFSTRVIRAFPSGQGYGIGSIEGRVGINLVEGPPNANFAFKCHRVKQQIYGINDISFSKHGSFATVGSDGTMHYWCQQSRTRLKQFKRCSLPLTACAFNGDSTMFVYASGYDWHKGAAGFDQNNMKPLLFLRPVQDAEIHPKPAGSK